MNAPHVRTARSADIIASTESALRAVRVLLAVSASFLILAYRPVAGSASWPTMGLVPVLIALIVLGLNTLSIRNHTNQQQSWWSIALRQGLDVAATVALVVALDAPLGGEAWVLLVVPVVAASVRYGAAVSMGSWAAGVGAYAGCVFAGQITASNSSEALVRIAGILLVIAATVGILARWMREGWEIQHELTGAAAIREQRLAVIEGTGRAMAHLTPEEVVVVCLEQALALAFDAATARDHDATHPEITVGRNELVSDFDAPERLTAGEAVVTRWIRDTRTVAYSASVLEPQTSTVITGWSESDLDTEQAEALLTLVAQASTNIETTSLLSQLRHDAGHDALTGLPNRRVFEEALERASNTYGDLAVCFVDIDYFKQVNDKFGHATGDHIISVVARRLQSCIAANDLVARIGGDEFVILLRDTDRARAQAVGEAVVASMHTPIVVDGRSLLLHVSAGIATATAPLAPKELLAAADAALYKAKASGRNRLTMTARSPIDPPTSDAQPAMPPQHTNQPQPQLSPSLS